MTKNNPPAEPPEAPKLRFEHSLQVRRIWLDRMLIGALLAVAGLVANVVLEKYKADRGQSQFYLDKRLAAATEVRRALTEVTTALFKISEAPCLVKPFDPVELQRLRDALSKLVGELNSSSILFDEVYLAEANRAINIFAGVAAGPSALSCDARPFLAEIARYLTHQTKRQVAPDALQPWRGFVLLNLSTEDMDRMGANEYYSKNFARWRSANLASPSSSASSR